MKRKKIGTGYYRRGYGRASLRKANIYLIDGFAYARDKHTASTQQNPMSGELENYVRVNFYTGSLGDSFIEVNGITDSHTKYLTH